VHAGDWRWTSARESEVTHNNTSHGSRYRQASDQNSTYVEQNTGSELPGQIGALSGASSRTSKPSVTSGLKPRARAVASPRRSAEPKFFSPLFSFSSCTSSPPLPALPQTLSDRIQQLLRCSRLALHINRPWSACSLQVRACLLCPLSRARSWWRPAPVISGLIGKYQEQEQEQ
jgi:hypothetical protein